MRFKHLTEEKLQELADGREIPEHAATHLRACAICTEQLDTYRQLFSAIANQPAAEFDFNVAETIMPHLPQLQKKTMHIGISVIMLLIIAGMCATVAWIFKDVFTLFLKNISWLIPAFILVSLATVAFALAYDMLRRYNKKIDFINSLK